MEAGSTRSPERSSQSAVDSDGLPDHTRHALQVIEYRRALEMVARHAASPYGQELVRGSAPRAEHEWIRTELTRVGVVRSVLRQGVGFAVPFVPDVRPALRRLHVPGSTLDASELHGLAQLLAASRASLSFLSRNDVAEITSGVLGFLARRFVSEPAVERAIERAIGPEGEILDTASATLKRIRRDLTAHREQIVKLLERVAGGLEAHQRLPDVAVTVRNGRYVIPVRRDARNAVGGIVHGASASGGTLFVEPPAAIEHGNRVSELESDEEREIDRILRELTDLARPHQENMSSALDAFAELDCLLARAQFGEQLDCASFELAPGESGFSFRRGRHPLLVDQGLDVVPFDLEMAPAEKTLLISGPNTGGKTVLLKSVALLSAMAQSGIPIPVGAGSRIPVFDDFFADIGDEQSLEASLSTFSAHLRNISVILEKAGHGSLVLMDEVGSGTDPVEGAALAAAVLEELSGRGAVTLATTHLGTLQQLAAGNPRIVNASLQFDSVHLAPTFHFVKGIPGRSYGLSIARRLGLPQEIVKSAEAGIPEGERNLAALLASLEAREKSLSEREALVAADIAQVSERARVLADRETQLQRRQIDFERESRKAARKHLLDSRAEVERTIKELRAGRAEKENEAARNARRRIEELAGEHDARLRELDQEEQKTSGAAVPAPVAPGDTVLVESLGGRRARVLEIRGGDVLVAVGVMKATVPLASVSSTVSAPAEIEVVPLRGELPEEHVSPEIDLRGKRVDEVDQELIPALDAAARAGLPVFRIIHGKGTGALRGRVQEILARDNRVRSFRDGAWNEGGIGATVVDLS